MASKRPDSWNRSRGIGILRSHVQQRLLSQRLGTCTASSTTDVPLDHSMSHGSKDNVEEDWSSIMSETTTGFSKHETQTVRVSATTTLAIECVRVLSPLDMMNLTHGNHDATGHKIWMGAYLFIEAMARQNTLQGLFRSKRVLEIGCGSGVAGLALLLNSNASGGAPASIHFTDSDAAALQLCEKNCRRNLTRSDTQYSILSLEWGNSLGEKKFDTILATDVLYDLTSLDPMLRTVSETLVPSGRFVLAHVPRASLPGEARVGTAEELELCIVREARMYSLDLVLTIRARDIVDPNEDASLNSVSLREMEEAGAAILVFGKLR